MTSPTQFPSPLRAVIACGGTGGHLFPGMAVAEQLRDRGCRVTLLISPKAVDREGTRGVKEMEVITLPAVGLTRGGKAAFVRGFWQSYRTARQLFRERPPQMALSMGGFTAAPPLLAARRSGARIFLHESNSIPGRANRWLSWSVERAFVGFPSASARLHTRQVTVTGTPVRPQFKPRPAEAARAAVGLDPQRPALVVIGGSQGASALNDLMTKALPFMIRAAPELQYFHLAGPADAERVRRAYGASHAKAVVHGFFNQMELALGAATIALSRAGASSLAEVAAMRVPAVLVPYPAATDDHQVHNARAFEASGAARFLEQRAATPEWLVHLLADLVHSQSARQQTQAALAQWDAPGAAAHIAEAMLEVIECSGSKVQRSNHRVQISPQPKQFPV